MRFFLFLVLKISTIFSNIIEVLNYFSSNFLLYDFIVSFLIAVFTLCAVLVALFQEQLKNFFYCPKLDFNIHKWRYSDTKTDKNQNIIFVKNCIILRVKNIGKRTANNVKCIITEKSLLQNSSRELFIPTPLPWLLSYGGKDKNIPLVYTTDILPEEEKLVFFVFSDFSNIGCLYIAEFGFNHLPNQAINQGYMNFADEAYLNVKILCENSTSFDKRICVKFTELNIDPMAIEAKFI